MAHLKFIALLGNVDKSILQIELGNDFHIQEWPAQKFVDFFENGFAEDTWFKLENEWGYGHARQSRRKHVYVIVKEHKDFPYIRIENDMEKWSEMNRKRTIFEKIESDFLTDKITKLRLCKEGSINLCVQCYYGEYQGKIEPDSSTEEVLYCESRLYKIKKSEVDKINHFLKSPPLKTNHAYLRFGLENFLESYRVAHNELEFIVSMIALETLFNDGNQELSYKISRNCAVLLGKTKDESNNIYKSLKDLYSKRSTLVHTGNKSTVSQADTIQTKDFVRKSLFKIIQLNLSKQDLVMKLNESGFGSYRRVR